MKKKTLSAVLTVRCGKMSWSCVDVDAWWEHARLSCHTLSAAARRGSNGQWFAVVLDTNREPILTSDALSSETEALSTAQDGLSLLLEELSRCAGSTPTTGVR